MLRLRAPPPCLLAIASLAFTGCRDTRRDAARSYLNRTHRKISRSSRAGGNHRHGRRDSSRANSTVRYRSIHPTVAVRDAFTQPRGKAIDQTPRGRARVGAGEPSGGDPTSEAILAERNIRRCS